MSQADLKPWVDRSGADSSAGGDEHDPEAAVYSASAPAAAYEAQDRRPSGTDQDLDLQTINCRLELERVQEGLRHKARQVARQEYPSLDVSAPSRTIDVSGREYRQLADAGRRRSILGLPVASPVSAFAAVWQGVTTATDLTYTSFVVALSLAFNGRNSQVWLSVLDLVGSVIYLLDLLLGFHIGFLARWDGRVAVVTDGREVARRYVREGTFLVDLLANLPSVAQLVLLAAGRSDDAWRVLWLLRMLRLARVFHLLASLQRVQTAGGVLRVLSTRLSSTKLMVLTLMLSLAILLNLLGCLWWLLAVAEGLDHSWAASLSFSKYVNLQTASNWDRWLWSVYFATTTVLTIGYGDITPETTLEAGFAIIFMLVGVAYFGYLLSTISSLLDAKSAAGRTPPPNHHPHHEVDGWMAGQGLPSALQRQIRWFFTCSWAPALEHDASRVFDDLPRELQLLVAQQQQRGALRGLDLLPPQMVGASRRRVQELVAAASTPRTLCAGEHLWRYGEQGSSLVILDEGELLMEAVDGSRELAVVPTVLGVSALFAWAEPKCRTRQATVRGLSSVSRLWVVDADVLGRQLAAEFPLALRHLALSWLDRVDALLRHLQQHRQQYEQEQLAEAAAPAPAPGGRHQQHQQQRRESSARPSLQHLQPSWSGVLLLPPPPPTPLQPGPPPGVVSEQLLQEWREIADGVRRLTVELQPAAEEQARAEQAQAGKKKKKAPQEQHGSISSDADGGGQEGAPAGKPVDGSSGPAAGGGSRADEQQGQRSRAWAPWSRLRSRMRRRRRQSSLPGPLGGSAAEGPGQTGSGSDSEGDGGSSSSSGDGTPRAAEAGTRMASKLGML